MTVTTLSAPEHIRNKRDRAFKKLNDDQIPQSAKADVRPIASRILTLERQMETPTAFEQHVSGALTDAIEKFEAGEIAALCSCSNPACPLKSGRVPPRLRSRGTGVVEQADPRELAVVWLERHRGDGHALRLALSDWDSKRSEYFELIERMSAELYRAETASLVQQLAIPVDDIEDLRKKVQRAAD